MAVCRLVIHYIISMVVIVIMIISSLKHVLDNLDDVPEAVVVL